ncbi:malate-2H(+)/Na(+)-lactate antiporter MleN [Clostridium aceticum]|uniref:Malate-2H(+)/Na(+)-lactate antiporter MleN n=1 Tax=Clostridium aceticum TaxID=84022 RepID=A0A0D8I8E6_9CLOT|nr:Na+/H+ antiporter NhaC family protein [Clostridium aceticum]AKL97293.1 malate-2H(+)/Na(+)-lactate antiporter MleN [Clostridium aceticum]KJF26312.1 sodium:proton antiporter [Clostridium aceticum]
MDIIAGMLITFCVLIFSIYKGIFVGYPLLMGFLIFSYISLRRGFSLSEILIMSYTGGKKAFVVLKIFVLIGAITAIWMAAGTVPGIVYYGIKFMNPNFFILYTFLISSLVSFLLGTSLGTVSTVGLALIVMAKSGNVDPNIAAGAIIAGAYFGDRCSPMSSSANLVANLTETNLYINIRNMFKTSIIPLLLSMVLYTIISFQQPLSFIGSSIDNEIVKIFTINWYVLLPSLIIIVLSILKVNVKLSMLFSILAASIISVSLQQQTLPQILRYMLLGFHLDSASPLYTIIKGGGIVSMWKASLVVFVSCSLAGVFDGTNMLKSVENILMKAKTRFQLFSYTTGVSILTAAFGCNQSIAAVLTNQLMTNTYKEKNVDKYALAIDLENTGIVLAALIPWNIAAFVPTSTMNVSSIGFIPYAFYLYLLPIVNIIYFKISETSYKVRPISSYNSKC